MILRKFVVFCFFLHLATAAIAAPAHVQTQTADDELIQLLNNIHTMQATFKQFMVNDAGAPVGKKTSGQMALVRPGKFRWEATQPSKQLIIVNDNNVMIYDVDLEQVIKRKVDYKQPGNPAMLLSGSTETLKQVFKITKLKKEGGGIWFKLTPKKITKPSEIAIING